MPAIIKNELRVLTLDAFAYTVLNNPTYFYLSGQSAWSNELDPPTPKDNTYWENFSLRDVFGLKRILPTDISAVLPRIDWIENTVYDQYEPTVDMVNERNPDTGDFYRFYVVTEEFNVYMCLSNNNRGKSTTMPAGTTPEPFTTPDHYTWKYMYTIRSQDAFKFMTENWIPCYTLNYNNDSSQWNSQESAVPGTIDNIIVTSKGAGYSVVNPPTVSIVGDGTGATAAPVINPSTGELIRINITNRGSGYTTATVNIFGGNGLGAEARATFGPRLGHGRDPRVELGATYMMIKTSIDGDEGGVLPTDVSFRSSGIIQMPGSNAPSDTLAIKIDADRAKLFSVGDVVTGAQSSASADVLMVDIANSIIYVGNVSGVFAQSEQISSNPVNASNMLSISSGFMPLDVIVGDGTDFDIHTGRVLYIANREKITRQPGQREDIIALLSF